MTPHKRIVFDGRDIVATTIDSGSSEAIVTFRPWSVKPLGAAPAATAAGFGEDAFSKRQVDEFHVIPRHNHWYQTREMESVIDAARTWLQGRQAVAYGSSMGGYGALAFGGTLGIASVALAPQFSIDRSVVPFERRWAEEAAKIERFDNSLIDRKTTGYIFYDPLVRLDRLQAHNILSRSNCSAVRCPLSGHSVPRHVNKVMPLPELVLSVMRRTFSIDEFHHKRRKVRLNEPNYVTNLYVALKRDHRDACAERFQEKAWSAAAKGIVDCSRLFHQAMAAGEISRAQGLFALGRTLLRGQPAEYVVLATMAWKLGEIESGLDVVEEGLARAPQNQKLLQVREQLRSKAQRLE